MTHTSCAAVASRFFRMSLSAAAALMAVCAGTLPAQEGFEDLLNKVPPSANAILVIDAGAVQESTLAVRGNWKELHEQNFMSRPLILPPEADRLVIASQLQTNRDFAQTYELAVMTLNEPMTMRSVARAEGGYVDTVNGLEAAWTPTDAYFVSFSEQIMAVMHPGNRQAVSRWAEFARTNSTPLISPYLKAASARVNKVTPLVMAFDLKDAVQPHKLREALAESELVGDDQQKLKAWERTIQGLRGVTLAVSFSDPAIGTLTVDFEVGANELGDDAKKLVLSAMERFGVAVDDFETWKATVRSDAVELRGKFTEPGMRRVFSLLELPSTNFSTLKGESPAEENETDKIVAASKQYFTSVSTLLDDIRKEFETNRDARHGLASVYMERYARKIDRLPILNVDEQLLGYGATVAETLRGASVTNRMAGVNTGVARSSTYGAYQYYYDGNGYYYSRPSSSVKTQAKREYQAEARETRFDSWKQIEDATAAMRRQMTTKYMVEF